MATLAVCGVCGGMVASTAKVCPKCGAPPETAVEEAGPRYLSVVAPARKKPGFFGAVALVFVVLVVIGAVMNRDKKMDGASSASGKADPAPPTTVEQRLAASTPAEDEKRDKLIAKLIRGGIFVRVVFSDGGALVVVGATFSALTYQEQAGFANVVLTQAMRKNAAADFVTFRDVRTGKDVGSASPANGFMFDP